jgi:hypothetical protein
MLLRSGRLEKNSVSLGELLSRADYAMYEKKHARFVRALVSKNNLRQRLGKDNAPCAAVHVGIWPFKL